MIARRPLPLDLVALVHHVELAEAGWRRRAVEQILLATLVGSPHLLEPDELHERILRQFGVELESDEVEKTLGHLMAQGSLMRLQSGKIKLSEASSATIEAARRNGEQLEARFRERFQNLVRSTFPDKNADELWPSFQNDFMFPFLSELGARVYAFISGDGHDLEGTRVFQGFLSRFDPNDKGKLTYLINQLFDSKDSNARAYTLSHLHARFLIDASNLGESVLSDLTQRIDGGISLSVFVDTNFLFAILGLAGC